MTFDAATILLIEDDSVDAMAVKRAFRDLKIANPIVEAHNGIEALEHLRGGHGHAPLRWPCLVLLDLKMPRMGGHEFLAIVRDDPSLRSLLVFVLTTSELEEDRTRAYDKNIAGYVLKHNTNRDFAEKIRILVEYWRTITLPPVRQGCATLPDRLD